MIVSVVTKCYFNKKGDFYVVYEILGHAVKLKKNITRFIINISTGVSLLFKKVNYGNEENDNREYFARSICKDNVREDRISGKM